MMTSTHTVVGAGLGLVTGAIAPELATPALVVGAIGGTFPDADLLATHRRSLHFPVGYGVLAILTGGLAVAQPTPQLVLLAVFLCASVVHCAMDVFAGGVEPHPWEANSTKGVYNHLTGRWIRPRRWVRYAGAPEDLGLVILASVPVLTMTTGGARFAVMVMLVCSAFFTIYRRRLGRLGERLAG